MNLVKRLAPIAMLSLLVGCQTQKSVELNKEPQTTPTPTTTSTTIQSKSTNTTNTKLQEKSTYVGQKGCSSIYAINNSMGYYYENGILRLIVFPKTILDEIYEGDYKIIRAR